MRGVGRVADTEACTVHSKNISQRQYFAARCLISCVRNAFGSDSTCVCFPSNHKVVT
jgi:hypothetical protein